MNLICKLSRILHPTRLIYNRNCYFKCRHLICWWILSSSCDSFIFMYVLVSTYLILYLSVWIWTSSSNISPLCYFISGTARKPFRPPVLPRCCHTEWWGRGVTHLISAKPGWDIIQMKAKRDSIGKHHIMLFVYCTCLLGVMLKSGSTLRDRKAGRCWKWLKGWLNTGTLSPWKCVCVYSTTLKTWQVLEIWLNWENSGRTMVTYEEFLF